MWWQKKAYLWLGVEHLYLLKIRRNLLGQIRSCQGEVHRWQKRKSKKIQVLELLEDVGLSGWRLSVLLSGTRIFLQEVSLGTEENKEARRFIREEELLGEATNDYAFAAVCPRTQENGLVTWTVGACLQEIVDNLVEITAETDVFLQEIDLLPAFLGRLQPHGQGTIYLQETVGKLVHQVQLDNGLPLTYKVGPGFPTELENVTDSLLWQEAGKEARPLLFDRKIQKLWQTYALLPTTAMLAAF